MPRTEPRVARLLREADGLLQGLFSNALIGVYVIQDARFVFVNPYLANLFAYSQEAMCSGMGPLDLVAAVDRDEAVPELARHMNGENTENRFSFRGQRQDGSQFDVEVFDVATQFSGRPALIGMLLDVSERRLAEQAVADQLRFIAQLVDTIPNAVYYKDEEGRYLGCNTAFERNFGFARGELLGRTVFDIAPPALAASCHAADMELFQRTGLQTFDSTVTHVDGSQHAVVFYKATFNKADGRLGGLVGLILDISDRKRLEDTIWHEANYDALTGLPNLRMLRDRLQEEMKRAHRSSDPLALLFIDLDHFKEVNDTLGHTFGDSLLIQAAQRIRDCLRATDTVARQGGDEFVVILPNVSAPDAVNKIAQDIRRALARPFTLASHLAYVSASIGVALYPDDSREIDALLSHADQAMYAAKSLGRNGVCHFTRSMQTQAIERNELGNELREALARGQLDVLYQPIVDLTSGHTIRAEALLRWNHPRRGRLDPSTFISLAEDIGLIGEIGNWAFLRAIETGLRWHRLREAQEDGPGRLPAIQICVNISARQFIAGHCENWLEDIYRIGLPPSLLVLEITEPLLLDARTRVIDALLSFRAAGVQISIDDFGTGYSALSYLKRFSVGSIKIDHSFVRDLCHDPGAMAITEAVIVMAHRLGIRVVAEGVETEEQRLLLRRAGCDDAQGYLFAEALSAEAFQHFRLERRTVP